MQFLKEGKYLGTVFDSENVCTYIICLEKGLGINIQQIVSVTLLLIPSHKNYVQDSPFGLLWIEHVHAIAGTLQAKFIEELKLQQFVLKNLKCWKPQSF